MNKLIKLTSILENEDKAVWLNPEQIICFGQFLEKAGSEIHLKGTDRSLVVAEKPTEIAMIIQQVFFS